MKLLDGVQVARKHAEELAAKVTEPLGLGIIVATDNKATHSYVNSKKKKAAKVGFTSEVIDLGGDAREPDILEAVHSFNQNPAITGFIVQLPLPDGVDVNRILNAIDPDKDADGLTPTNLGYMLSKQPRVLPATPKGVLSLLDDAGVELVGAQVTIIGKGILTGLPLAALMSHRKATVTACDSKTKDLAKHTREADVILAAAGRPGLLTGDMVSDGVVVVDIGTTKTDGKLQGDVVFDEVAAKASLITPVPGGVGPMTVISLLENVYELSKLPPA